MGPTARVRGEFVEYRPDGSYPHPAAKSAACAEMPCESQGRPVITYRGPSAAGRTLTDHGTGFSPRSAPRAFVIQGAGLFEEVVIAAGVGTDLSSGDVQDLGREFADEVHVVGDEDQRAPSYPPRPA